MTYIIWSRRHDLKASRVIKVLYITFSIKHYLVHEQAHLWQQHFGARRSRGGYHNREWADKMEALGLMPSNSGGPGGKRTGQQMSHYILPDGDFARAVRELLATGFRLHWESLARRTLTVGDDQQPVQDLSKVRFTCPACGQHAWAKSTAKLLCGICTLPIRPELFVKEVSMENK